MKNNINPLRKLTEDDLSRLLESFDLRLAAQKDLTMMTGPAIHGLLTAILIGPRAIMPRVWLPFVFFKQDEIPDLGSKENSEVIISDLLTAYNAVSDSLHSGEFAPYISWRKTPDGEEIEEWQTWCCGFIVGTYPFAKIEWNIFEDQYLAELCLPILYYAESDVLPEIYSAEQLEDMRANSGDPGDLVLNALLEIRNYFEERFEDMDTTAAEHNDSEPGRNDPCPCGSGKKYKRCCGG